VKRPLRAWLPILTPEFAPQEQEKQLCWEVDWVLLQLELEMQLD
jgi:hypothetical protein